MFRFTIRDVLWITVVVAVAMGWWLELGRRQATISHTLRLRDAMFQAKCAYDECKSNLDQSLTDNVQNKYYTFLETPPDWRIIYEPIPGHSPAKP